MFSFTALENLILSQSGQFLTGTVVQCICFIVETTWFAHKETVIQKFEYGLSLSEESGSVYFLWNQALFIVFLWNWSSMCFWGMRLHCITHQFLYLDHWSSHKCANNVAETVHCVVIPSLQPEPVFLLLCLREVDDSLSFFEDVVDDSKASWDRSVVKILLVDWMAGTHYVLIVRL